MRFEEAYVFFVLKQNRKMHPTAPLGEFIECEWEQFFIPKEEISTSEDKECWWSWTIK